MYDLVIKNGKIIDGTGSPGFFADVAIKDGKIAKISKGLTDAKKTIDASRLIVTPGFIDSHSHSDRSLLEHPDQTEKVEQGITTSIGGVCGLSPAPLPINFPADSSEKVGEFGKKTEVYKNIGTFFDAARKSSFGSSLAAFIGHASIREAVMGLDNRKPTEEELNKMKDYVHDAMKNGALGISFGLIYTPSCYAKTEELIELAKVVSEYNGIISAHIRNEGDYLAKSTEEFISVVKAANVRGVLSHHKAMLKENWGKVSHTLRMIDQANDEGYELYCDTYPYTASATTITARFIPKEYHTDGIDGICKLLEDTKFREKLNDINTDLYGSDTDWVLLTNCKSHPEYNGLTLTEISQIRNTTGYNAIYDIICESRCADTACFFTVCEEDLKTVLKYPRTMICTDSATNGGKNHHPRISGSFTRALGKYVREEKVTTLPDMIRKMTSMPAAVYGLSGKGLIKEGFDADICIFDFDKIIDRSDYTDSTKKADGLNYVLVDGEIVAENAVFNGTKKGKLITIKRR